MSKKRVRSLLRVSSRQQLHDDDIPIQRAEIADYIFKQPNWEFDSEYIEKAVSAFKNTVQDREVLLQILEDARAHKFDILLTYMSDRIGRKEEYSMYIATLNRLGIEVWTIKEGQLKTQDDTDRLMLYIKFWGNERESNKTGQRVKDAQKEMIKAGKHVGGYAPYGYEFVYSGEISSHGRSLKRHRIVEEQAKVVREIFRLSVEEDLGAYAIAKRLNEQGIPGIHGGEWRAGTVSDRLKNPIYMGYLTYNRRSHKDTYKKNPQEEWIFSEAPLKELEIVTPEIWQKAQQRRKQRRQKAVGGKEKSAVTTSGSLALMGLAYCACCGKKLTNGSRYDSWTLKNGEKVKKMCGRYKCTQRADASAKCNGKTLHKQKELEDAVFEVVGQYLSGLKKSNVYRDIIEKQEAEQRNIRKEWESIRKKCDSIHMDINTLNAQIPQAMRGEGVFSEERLSSILKEKEAEQNRLNQQLRLKQQEYKAAVTAGRDLNGSPEFIPDWNFEFQKADTHLKKVLLSKLIERIEVGREEIKIIFKISETAFHRRDDGTKPRKAGSPAVPE